MLVTDAASDLDIDVDAAREVPDLRAVLADHARRGNLFDAVHPALLRAIVDDDPWLKKRARLSEPLEAWLWTNGPERTFLVYALELRGRAHRVGRR